MTRSIRYLVRYLVHHSNVEREASFDSALQREIFVISITPYARVLEEWQYDS